MTDAAGRKLTVHDYYRWIFENAVPGLPEAAAKENLTPLEYMRRYGAFLIESDVHDLQSKPTEGSATAETDPAKRADPAAAGVMDR